MKKGFFIFVITLMFVTACGDTDQPEVKTIKITNASSANDADAPVVIKIILNTVNMRKSPNISSPVVAKLPANSKLEWLGQVSKVTAPIKLRGVRYNDPWLYVKTNEGKTGWIYAATASVDSTNNPSKSLQQLLVRRRAQGFFGAEIVTAMDNYRAAYVQANTSDKFANMYIYGLGLRDKMVQVLRKKASTDSQNPADMSWLDSLLPGYKHARVAEGTAYYLFADYQQWAAKARQTSGVEDDQFIELYQAIFPDAQEGFFPAWMEQISDYGARSLLGRGIHKKILDKLDALNASSSPFSEILNSLKHEIIQDITNTRNNFSEPVNKRKEEIRSILNAGYSILSDKDKKALENLL